MLTPAWTPLRPHRQQSLLWRSCARWVDCACGRGSGKTEIARRRLVRYLPVKKAWPNPMYFYAMPTLEHARRVAWEKIKALVPTEWLAGPPNESRMIIRTIFGSSLYVMGMDKPMRIEGDQWDAGITDETSDIKPGAFFKSIVPAMTHKAGAWCWRIGVPKRTGVGAAEYKDFCHRGVKLADDGANLRDFMNAEHQSFSWPSSTVLTEEQLRLAKENMDPRDFDEQFNANWLSSGGLCFYCFVDEQWPDGNLGDPKILQIQPDAPLLIFSDFNVDPMAWVVAQHAPGDKEQLWVLDEVWLRNTSTQQALNELHRRYGEHHGGFHFFGDASSKARKTSATSSDYAQIKADERFRPKIVIYPDSNPAVMDRIACCNRMFCSAADARRVRVHPRCTWLRKDLQSRAFKPGTSEPDDSGDIGHITDALGYGIHRMYPITYQFEQRPAVHVRG